MDVTVWTWQDLLKMNGAMSLVYLCKDCRTPMVGDICSSCHEQKQDEGMVEGSHVIGSLQTVAEHVGGLFQTLGFDADILVVTMPVGVADITDIHGVARLPLDEIFTLGSHVLYTRDALTRDTMGGATIVDCLKACLHG
jgi:hypothetical protein